MTPLTVAAIVGGLVLVFFVVQFFYLAGVLAWENARTRGLSYYGRSQADRAAYREAVRRHARRLKPILRLTSRLSRFRFDRAGLQAHGHAFPRGSCSEASVTSAVTYEPTAEDVFVTTQMKCGTTWMQHVVYEVLHRGQGNLVESGTAMYAVSPWIEGVRSVSMADAPLLGTERPSRVIKTHLPAPLCPTSPEARYIYVVRHPVSCFASCGDFIQTNVGAMAPGLEATEAWFRDPAWMWWGTWTDHVADWWDRSVRDSNVLFVQFETMRQDLAGVVQQVAAFLGVAPLTDAETAEVVRKCGFKYMQEHQNTFEMHPPHLLQADAELFVRGTADRHKDVPADTRDRLARWAVAELKDRAVPLRRLYPDLFG